MVFYSRDKVVKGSTAPHEEAVSQQTKKTDSHSTDSTGDMEDDIYDDETYESGDDMDGSNSYDSDDGSSAPPDDYYDAPIRNEKPAVIEPDSPSNASDGFGSFDLVLPRGSMVSPLSLNESVTGLMMISPEQIRVPFAEPAGAGAAAAIRQRRSRVQNVQQQQHRPSATASSRRSGNERTARRTAEEATLQPRGGRRQGDPLSSSVHGGSQRRGTPQQSRSFRGKSKGDQLAQSEHGLPRQQRRPSNENVQLIMGDLYGGDKKVNKNKDLSKSEHSDFRRSSSRDLSTSDHSDLRGRGARGSSRELSKTEHSDSLSRKNTPRESTTRSSGNGIPRSHRTGLGRSRSMDDMPLVSPTAETKDGSPRKLPVQAGDSAPIAPSRSSRNQPRIRSRSADASRALVEDNENAPTNTREQRSISRKNYSSSKDELRTSSHGELARPSSIRSGMTSQSDDGGLDKTPPSTPQKGDRNSHRRGSSNERKPSHSSSAEGHTSSSRSPRSSRRRLRTQRSNNSDEQDTRPEEGSPRDEKGRRRRLRANRDDKADNNEDRTNNQREKEGSRGRTDSVEVSRRPASQSPSARRRRGVSDGLKRNASGEGQTLRGVSPGPRRRLRRGDSGDNNDGQVSGDDQSMDGEQSLPDDNGEGQSGPNRPQHFVLESAPATNDAVSANQVQEISDPAAKAARPGFARSLFAKTGSIANLKKAMRGNKNTENTSFGAMQDLDGSYEGNVEGGTNNLGDGGGNGLVTQPKELSADSSTNDVETETSKESGSSPKRRQSTRQLVMEKSSSLSTLASRALIYASAKKSDKKGLLDDCSEGEEDSLDDDENKLSFKATEEKEKEVRQPSSERNKLSSMPYSEEELGGTATTPQTSSMMDSFSDFASFSMEEVKEKRGQMTSSLPPVQEPSEEVSEEDNKLSWDASFSQFGDVGLSSGCSIDMAGRFQNSDSNSEKDATSKAEGSRPSLLNAKSMSSARKVVSQATSVSNLLRYASAKKVEKKSLLDSFSGLESRWEQEADSPAVADPILDAVVEGDVECEVSKWKKLSAASGFIASTKKKVDDRKSSEMDASGHATSGKSAKWGLLKKSVETKEETTGGTVGNGNTMKTFEGRKSIEMDGTGHSTSAKSSKWGLLKKSVETKEETAGLGGTEGNGNTLKTSEGRKSIEMDGTGHSTSKKSSKWGLLKNSVVETAPETVVQGSTEEKGKSNEMDGTGHSIAGKSSKWGLLKQSVEAKEAKAQGDIADEKKADAGDANATKWGKLKGGIGFISESKRRARRRREKHQKEAGQSEDEVRDPPSAEDKIKQAMDLVAAVSRDNAQSDRPSAEGECLADEAPKKSSASKWDALRKGVPVAKETDPNTENKGAEADKQDTVAATSKWDKLRQHTASNRPSSDAEHRHDSKWSKLKVSNDFIRQTQTRTAERRRRARREKEGGGEGATEQSKVDSERALRRRLRRERGAAEVEKPEESRTADQPTPSSETQGGERESASGVSSERPTASLPSKWAGLKGQLDAAKDTNGIGDTEKAVQDPSSSSKWAGLKDAMVKDSKTSETESSTPSRGTSSRSSSRRNWDKVKAGADFINETQRRARASERRRQRREAASTETTAAPESSVEKKAADPSMPSKWAGLKDAMVKDAKTSSTEGTKPSRGTSSRSSSRREATSTETTAAPESSVEKKAADPNMPSKWAGLKDAMVKDAKTSSTEGTKPSRGTSSRSSSRRNWDKVKASADFINETQRRARANERRRQRREASNTDAEASTTLNAEEKLDGKAEERRKARSARTLLRQPSNSDFVDKSDSGVTKVAGNDASKWQELDIVKLASQAKNLGASEQTENEVKNAAPLASAAPIRDKAKSRWKALKGGMDFIHKAKTLADDDRKKERRQRRAEKETK